MFDDMILVILIKLPSSPGFGILLEVGEERVRWCDGLDNFRCLGRLRLGWFLLLRLLDSLHPSHLFVEGWVHVLFNLRGGLRLKDRS